MIVSIRHNTLKSLFEKGTSTGVSRELKDFLLLWLSVIHATNDLRDLSIKNISILEEGVNSYRLKVHGVGIFSFRFIDGEIRQLDYKDDSAVTWLEAKVRFRLLNGLVRTVTRRKIVGLLELIT